MFNYDDAFSRNLGWVTPAEQSELRSKCVAIAGMGGVGGSHLLTLARLGVGRFHIADFDTFEVVNFNRQAGAMVSTLGQPKTEVLAAMVRDINPELDLRVFPKGIDAHNMGDFLDGVDLYVDGLDFFAFEARELVFAECARRGIPATTVAPLGMGAALINFLPGGMTFEEYFRVAGKPAEEKALRLLVGLAPARLHSRYLVEPSRIDLPNKRGPSTAMGCQLCAGIAATEALKILLRRGRVHAAPDAIHFDAFRNTMTRTRRGNNHPLQRLTLRLARRKALVRHPSRIAQGAVRISPTLQQILDLARWAPSGDNTQVWRFQIVDDHHVVVHGLDTRADTIYDVHGWPSQLAWGALLETMSIAASKFGLRADISRRADPPNVPPKFDVRFVADPAVRIDPLLPSIEVRSVQRRPLERRALTRHEKDALETAVGASHRVLWLENGRRRRVAWLMFENAKLRLTIPEAYRVHCRVIQWNARFSEDRMPDRAIGLDPLTTRLMQWVMGRWERVQFFNRYLAGTVMPRIQLDLLPGLFCAAHFVIAPERPPRSIDDYVAAGRAMQRFWLTATQLGLQLQPEVTPLAFATYVRAGESFSQTPGSFEAARRITARLSELIGADALERATFMGRVGAGPAPSARSLRLPLARLIVE
jgi:molybdopterin/thiamine biosynthesis adenylyltransferase/nitroreductase